MSTQSETIYALAQTLVITGIVTLMPVIVIYLSVA